MTTKLCNYTSAKQLPWLTQLKSTQVKTGHFAEFASTKEPSEDDQIKAHLLLKDVMMVASGLKQFSQTEKRKKMCRTACNTLNSTQVQSVPDVSFL